MLRSTLLVLAATLLAAVGAAQSLTGTIVDVNAAPIAGVTITLSNNGGTQVTNALGVFTYPLVQNRTYTVTISPPTTSHAPIQTTFRVQGASNMGIVTLASAARVFGTVLGPTGLPLLGANFDAIDSNGLTIFTPNDGTTLTGQFSVTVPLGPATLRVNPPSGQTLLRFETQATITADLDLGTITLPQAYTVSGNVGDAVSLLPIAGANVRAYNNITGVEILQNNNQTSALGAFSLQLPAGVFTIEFDPPTGNLHAARVRHGQLVVANTNLGLIGLAPAVQITGTVTGPLGPVPLCDIDILRADGSKLVTLHDNTDATGTFRVMVPAGNYRVRVDPPASNGLVGYRSPLTTFAASTVLPAITLQPGVLVQLGVVGPLGFEINADLDFFDPLTGEPVIIAGDKTDATGIMNAIVPTGTFDIALDAAQGSAAAGFRLQAPIAGPIATPVFLPSKLAVVDVHAPYGMQTIAQNGSLFVDVRLRNPQALTQPTLLEAVIVMPSSPELVLGALPLDLPPGIDITFGSLEIPMPTIPTTELGKDLRFYVRLRDTNQQLIDLAYVEFVVE